MKTFLKVLLWIVLIAALLFLALFLASKIGQFNTMGDMFRYIGDALF